MENINISLNKLKDGRREALVIRESGKKIFVNSFIYRPTLDRRLYKECEEIKNRLLEKGRYNEIVKLFEDWARIGDIVNKEFHLMPLENYEGLSKDVICIAELEMLDVRRSFLESLFDKEIKEKYEKLLTRY